MKIYAHGGNVKEFSEKLGIKSSEVIDLSSNINFLKPKINIDFNTLDIASYPDYNTIYESIAKHYGVKKDELELFNGGSSAIFSLFESLDVKHCTIYAPAYLEYKRVANLLHVKLAQINRFENIYETVKKNSFVVFVNPSTPDGKYYDLNKLFKIWKKANATVLIDESFLEFCGKKSALKKLKKYKKLYILKSMTKFYSSAGIRVGALLSNEKNIKKLKKKQALWKLSEFDINYLLEALKDKKFRKKSYKKNRENKEYLEEILLSSQNFEKVYKSDANFIMAKLKRLSAKEFQEKLQKHRVMVRDCSNFDFLDESYVRIAVKRKKDMKVLNEKY
ncbi:aminotransferase class I/II-fold pyridoxal phosphate-dependent enzyme [Sulfurospirillum arcachonense]|uniref:aminotransferase class I/II-fold pyridoxal phosphate-dependent enzyme n=1 Tax=Sulfurospirillum arcachonense TaxID=57666 RepID=UPI00046A4052|nr:aminotransferase class I/II-fold pyridoxal phosphate-dependent enzyme [Sulfurospirillum arcachonense]